MSNSKVLFQDLVSRINLPEDPGEIHAIAYMILEHSLGVTRTDVIAAREIATHPKELFDSIIDRINRQEPIQYILGEADFFGRKFAVNSSVLIPRQETETLINEILKFSLTTSKRVLDIGTGSGCIAITLALEVPTAEIIATDISEQALEVAKINADTLHAHVQFFNHNILKEEIPLGGFDVIVSNPPYISTEEKHAMQKNVLDFEPHLALFSENDPLLFYRHLATKTKKALNQNGKVVVEINEHFGKETLIVFHAAGFTRCDLIKDLQNKDRVIIAQ